MPRVFMSPDAGKSWQFMGLGDVGQVSRIVIDPANPTSSSCRQGHVWAPNASVGVFRTADGGKTWEKVLFVNDSTGAADLVMVPGNPRMLFAGMWQFVRRPWELVSGGAGVVSIGQGRRLDVGTAQRRLPSGLLGNIACRGRPHESEPHLYAHRDERGHAVGLEGSGDHWTKVSTSTGSPPGRSTFSLLHVSPWMTEAVLFVLTCCFAPTTAADDDADRPRRARRHHALWIDPQNPDRMIQGNDGGVYVTENGAKSWRFLNNLPIGQF